jgi:NADH:ubiquinone reductase (H+-translocating)
MEEADTCDDPEIREELLTFVFVGGGYAGLEALAELQDFAAEAIEAYPPTSASGPLWKRSPPPRRGSPPARPSAPEPSCGPPGVVPHPSSRHLGLPLDERGRIPVDDHRRVDGEDDVWAVGDAAAVPDPAIPATPARRRRSTQSARAARRVATGPRHWA